MGYEYDAPFGVAPIGLSGLIWPKSEAILAKSAKTHNIPYTLSTVATDSIENIGQIACDKAWFIETSEILKKHQRKPEIKYTTGLNSDTVCQKGGNIEIE